MTIEKNDFSDIREEDTLVDGATGNGNFVDLPPAEGIALLRLKDVIEFGAVAATYDGKPKTNPNRPVMLTFELVLPRHAINKKAEGDADEGPFTGDFVRNHEVTIRLPNKSFNERSTYYKLFNKMNFDGAVATPAGKVPSFASFLGKGFLGDLEHNIANKGTKEEKLYVNLDKDKEYTLRAPMRALVDESGIPTGELAPINVPEANAEQRLFLWESNVTDEQYTRMWNSIEIVGETDGNPWKYWIQDQIIEGSERNGPNLEWEGSVKDWSPWRGFPVGKCKL